MSSLTLFSVENLYLNNSRSSNRFVKGREVDGFLYLSTRLDSTLGLCPYEERSVGFRKEGDPGPPLG